MTEAYDEGEWILDQYERVGLWLARHKIRYAERNLHPDHRSRHMFVSDAETAQTVGLADTPGEDAGEAALVAVEERLDELEDRIATRVEKTLVAGGTIPGEELRAAFRLDELALDTLILLSCIASNNRIARACTNAWCDFTKKQPDVSFVLEMLAGSWAEAQTLRHHFARGSTLQGFGLIVTRDSDKWGEQTPLSYRLLSVPEELVTFLVSGRTAPPGPWVAFREVTPTALEELLVPDALKEQLVHYLRVQARDGPKARIILFGPAGVGKRQLCAGVVAGAGRKLLVCLCGRLAKEPTALVEQLRAAMRQARLGGAELYLHVPGGWLSEDQTDPACRRAAIDLINWYPDTVFIGAETEPDWVRHLDNIAGIQVPFPTAEVQEAIWRRVLAGRAQLEPGFTLDELVSSHSLSGGSIEHAAEVAIFQSRVRSQGRRVTIPRSIAMTSAQAELSHRLGLLAEKVTRMMSWDDLVLRPQTSKALRDLIDQYRHQHMVFNEWGFSTKVAYGRGLSALFHGPPGTGKTMVAGVIARELGLELYKIDLSRVVDKYIGETEKNLGRIFDEASRSRAILLFDEADSLFSKRTEVKSSHDRYANLETNYLLQRIESFDGVCLLTTNFEASIDDAFKRRLRFKIAFPAPDEVERERLWRSMIPEQANMSDDVDFGELAFLFEMTGGHIKNAVLRAAFMAARQGATLNNEIMLTAATEEYREMGKLIRG